jgi:hypothetical protein
VVEVEIDGIVYAKKLMLAQEFSAFMSLSSELVFSQMISALDENPEKETLFVKYYGTAF